MHRLQCSVADRTGALRRSGGRQKQEEGSCWVVTACGGWWRDRDGWCRVVPRVLHQRTCRSPRELISSAVKALSTSGSRSSSRALNCSQWGIWWLVIGRRRNGAATLVNRYGVCWLVDGCRRSGAALVDWLLVAGAAGVGGAALVGWFVGSALCGSCFPGKHRSGRQPRRYAAAAAGCVTRCGCPACSAAGRQQRSACVPAPSESHSATTSTTARPACFR